MDTQSLERHNAGSEAASAIARCAALVWVLAVSLLAASPSAFAGGPGSAGMQALKLDMSPRAAGMGGAFVAVADDIYTIGYNPAGLGQLYIPEASAVLHHSGIDDSKMNNISFGLPLPFIGLAGLAKPGFGMSLMLSDAGSFDYRYINYDGSVTKQSYDAQKDLALTFGYGEKVYSNEVNLEGYKAKIDQYLGMNIKYVKSTMLEHYSASGFAFDGGWLLLEPNLGLSLGASIANYGGGLKYASEVTKLPSIMRLGAAYERPTVLDQSVLLAAEADFYMNEAMKSLRFGLEYHFEKIFNLRLGYKTAEDNSGLTMGLGLHYNDMSMDFSSGMSNQVYNSTQLSFSYKFTGIVIKEYRNKVKYKDPQPARAEPDRAKPAEKPASRQAKPQENKKDSDFFWIY